jgi:L-rhamnose mutarotase
VPWNVENRLRKVNRIKHQGCFTNRELHDVPSLPTLIAILVLFKLVCMEHARTSSMATRKSSRWTRTVGGLIRLLPEYEERYIVLHQHTFPGVLRRIHASHIRNYSIFLRDGVLFSHYEYHGKDFAADMDAMARDRTTRDWWKLTDPMQRPLPTQKKGEWWASMECLARLAIRPVSPAPYSRYTFVTRLKRGSNGALRAALSKTPPQISRTIARLHFRNVHVYGHNGTLYVYAEYAGSNIEADALSLYRSKPFTLWRKGIEKLCSPGSAWEQMPEVFHTH